jgi:quercetin dioxygenase-like cupin family protein
MSEPSFNSIRRIVTGHNNKSLAIVQWDDQIQTQPSGHGPFVASLWSTSDAPADISSQEDRSLIPTGLTNDGSILRLVDFPPHSTGVVHRSMSLDYVLVLKGSIVMTLDSGVRKRLKEGDVVIQQATMHGWDNETASWTRLLVVLLPAKPPMIDGKELTAEVSFDSNP